MRPRVLDAFRADPVADALMDDMVAWRRDVHAHPELAFEETRTAGLIASALCEAGLAVEEGVGGTGIVATLRAGAGGKAYAFRADMDALPLDEANPFAHRSRHQGRMHACGHDGHAAMLLGAARYLAKSKSFSGVLHFIFQPAEEVGGGAAAMMRAGALKDRVIDGVFAMHNSPGMPVGEFAVWPGPVMAAASFFDITIIGKGGHAAMPQQSVDSVLVAAQIVSALQSIVSRTLDPLASGVVSVTQIHGGAAYNVIPEKVVLSGCVRALDKTLEQNIEARMRAIATQVAAAFGAEAQLDYRRQIPALTNAEGPAAEAARVAIALVGEDRVSTKPAPVMGSDDFAVFADHAPGCYALIGNGPAEGGCTVHSPHYDFNDEALPFGVAYWVRLAEHLMPKGRP